MDTPLPAPTIAYVVRPVGDGPFPLAIMNHGVSLDPVQRGFFPLIEFRDGSPPSAMARRKRSSRRTSTRERGNQRQPYSKAAAAILIGSISDCAGNGFVR